MANIIVLGAGMVGRTMALDLARDHRVTAVDYDEKALNGLGQSNHIHTRQLDVSDDVLLTEAVQPFDLVVCAVPGFMGFRTLKTLIEAGKDVVDISFMPEDALVLDTLAKERAVTVIVDIGVAPGMSNLLLGYHDARMNVESFHCLVGGLPKKRTWPFEYKAPFSPIDVIEEYTRPARYVENLKIVTRPALSDPELVDFSSVGTLEAFNTDGLRSILTTMAHIPNMKEKTLRYPGHIRFIQALKDSGFFKTEKIHVGKALVAPVDVTSQILFNVWRLEPDEEEITVMRVIIEGTEDGAAQSYIYHLFDEYDSETGASSMSRTTGYTCTAAANALLDELFAEKGVFAPELMGKNEDCFNYIKQYLEDRKVIFEREVKTTSFAADGDTNA